MAKPESENPHILVLDEFADDYRPYLAHLSDSVSYASAPHDQVASADVLLAQPDLAADYIRTHRPVKWIQSTWAGIKPLVAPLAHTSVQVTGIRDIFGAQISEYIFAYLLEDARKLAHTYDAQQNAHWRPFLPGTLSGKHLLILGTGSIGTHVAQVARTFAMRITGISRSGRPLEAFDSVTGIGALNREVSKADYVVLTIPETTETHHIINSNVLAAMNPDAMLINVSRGNTIDEAALLHAIQNKSLRKAVLDVFAREPLPSFSPLWSVPGIVVTPHIAAVSIPQDVSRIFLSNLQKFKHGSPLDYKIDLAKGY